MSDDWKPGDLALCVKGGRRTRAGGIYTVRALVPPGSRRKAAGVVWTNISGELGLLFVEFPDRGASAAASRFRKISPHTPDAEDAETIRLLTGAPVKVGAA